MVPVTHLELLSLGGQRRVAVALLVQVQVLVAEYMAAVQAVAFKVRMLLAVRLLELAEAAALASTVLAAVPVLLVDLL
jgi:hypothetical protein